MAEFFECCPHYGGFFIIMADPSSVSAVDVMTLRMMTYGLRMGAF